ncbi:MAG TPA: hypothetical protein VFE24_02070 [Pirellulales bacterium]|jgi:hypothetical protein|nr:hypothetical protein [Pirellulales bacterium]
MRFALGQIVITPTAEALLRQAGQTAHDLLARHEQGDWGEVSEDERQWNDSGIDPPRNLASRYRLRTGQSIMVFTKADRSVTMVHLRASSDRGTRARETRNLKRAQAAADRVPQS